MLAESYGARVAVPSDPRIGDRALCAGWSRTILPLLVIAGVGAIVGLAHLGQARGPVAADVAAVFGAALASSVAGFAFSAICGALLFHDGAGPRHAVQIMVVCSIAIQALSVGSLWKTIRWRPVMTFVGGGICGLPIGLFLLDHVPSVTYLRMIGLFLIAYGIYAVMRRPPAFDPGPRLGFAVDAFIGMLGGISGGFAAFPGAFITVWCAQRGWDKVRQRALFQPYILVMQLATFIALGVTAPAAHGPSSLLDFRLFGFVPVALTGAYLGLNVFHRLSDRQFSKLLSLMLVASGLGLAGVF